MQSSRVDRMTEEGDLEGKGISRHGDRTKQSAPNTGEGMASRKNDSEDNACPWKVTIAGREDGMSGGKLEGETTIRFVL